MQSRVPRMRSTYALAPVGEEQLRSVSKLGWVRGSRCCSNPLAHSFWLNL